MSQLSALASTEVSLREITLLEDVSAPDELLLEDHWSGADMFLGPHSETPYLQSFKARAGDLLTVPPEINPLARGQVSSRPPAFAR